LGFIPQTETPALSKTPWTGNALGFYAVRVADANVDISDADVQRAEADFKPDWGVNLTYQQRESGQGPRSNFDGTAIARQVQSEWSRYEARRETAVQNIRIIEQKISAIETQTEAQLITYESGNGDYSPIIDGEIAILMLRAEIVKEETLRDQMIAKMNSLLVPS